jgi:hypothetical protein
VRPSVCLRRRLTRVWRGLRAQHAGEPVAAAEFCADNVAVGAERLAQCKDLNLQVVFRHRDARPHSAEELVFFDEQAVRFQEDQKQIKGARAEFDRNAVGEQSPLTEQHAETPEFEIRVGGYRARPVRPARHRVFAAKGRLWVSKCHRCSPSPLVAATCNLARVRALAASLHKSLPVERMEYREARQ